MELRLVPAKQRSNAKKFKLRIFLGDEEIGVLHYRCLGLEYSVSRFVKFMKVEPIPTLFKDLPKNFKFCYIWLEDIYLLPPHVCKGYGSKILDLFCEMLPDNSAIVAMIHPIGSVPKEKLVRFYERNNFVTFRRTQSDNRTHTFGITFVKNAA